jgi:hypothetical protein
MNVSGLMSWIKEQQKIEGFDSSSMSGSRSSSSSDGGRFSPELHVIPVEPTASDILLGRGKSSQNHPGNIRFRQLIESKRPEYERAKVLEKTLIAERIVQSIRDLSGRFLRQTGNYWEEVDFDTARDKVAHAFRDNRRKQKQQQENSITKFASKPV